MNSVKLIAYHLTQFHPIPENDEWWGEGFTEWTNVVKGRPLFPGHQQPHVPGDLGYYDLRDESVRQGQASLAHKYGIDGFCYYYWFGGKRLLEQPVEAMLAGGGPDLPFCLCWANENWTRRWDGKDNEILIAQRHSPADDLAIITDLIRHFEDHRYIRIDGRPLLLVYCIDLLPDPLATAWRWREACRQKGIGEIYLCMVRRFGSPDPEKYGFDAAVDFPPHGCVASEITRAVPNVTPDFAGRIFSYLDMVRDALTQPRGSYPNFRGVLPSWDNTARKGLKSHIFHRGTPLRYRSWLAETIRSTANDDSLPQPIVFINAWNEWAEGCHLEPDAEYGTAWLEATRAARDDASAKERLWTRFGTKMPALGAEEERHLAGSALGVVMEALQGIPNKDVQPTFRARCNAFARRRVVRHRRLFWLALPIARALRLVD